MQFVKKGPDLPEGLLQKHEEGRVVFFCGAGISYPAGLPGFNDLVKQLYSDLNPDPNPVQKAAMKAGQHDTAIGLLEEDVVGGRQTVRKALVDILTPDLTAPKRHSYPSSLVDIGQDSRQPHAPDHHQLRPTV